MVVGSKLTRFRRDALSAGIAAQPEAITYLETLHECKMDHAPIVILRLVVPHALDSPSVKQPRYLRKNNGGSYDQSSGTKSFGLPSTMSL